MASSFENIFMHLKEKYGVPKVITDIGSVIVDNSADIFTEESVVPEVITDIEQNVRPNPTKSDQIRLVGYGRIRSESFMGVLLIHKPLIFKQNIIIYDIYF